MSKTLKVILLIIFWPVGILYFIYWYNKRYHQKLQFFTQETKKTNQTAHIPNVQTINSYEKNSISTNHIPNTQILTFNDEVSNSINELWDNESFHNTNNQLKRQNSAFDKKLVIIEINNELKQGYFKGSESDPYKTTLTSCTCVDFNRTKFICKHMYRLAHELEFYKINSQDLSTKANEIHKGTGESKTRSVNLFTKKWSNIANNEFIVLDIETTGLNKNIDRIVEISAIRYVNCVEATKFVTLVNPLITISAKVSAIHNITNEKVKDAQKINDILPNLINFLGDSLIVGHNAIFDIGFIEKAAVENGLSFSCNYIDTVTVAKRIFPDLINYKQETILNAIGYKQSTYHRAEDDCRGCAEIILAALKEITVNA